MLTGIYADRMRALVAALRSGEFEQATGTLRKALGPLDGVDFMGVNFPVEYRYCCLGVASELAVRGGVPPEVVWLNHHSTDEGDLSESKYSSPASVLTETTKEWYGFDSLDPTIHIRDNHGFVERISASSCNDGLAWTFNQIADAFENMFLTPDPEDDDATSSG